jgi:WD40 repeat protein
VRKGFIEQVPQTVRLLVGRNTDWDACRSVLEGHLDCVKAVVFSPDGQLVASASMDNTVRVWETATGQCRSVLEGHSYGVIAVVFSPDGQLVASASNDSTVRVWETATGQCRSVLKGHSDSVRAVVFSPDGRTLCTDIGDISLPLNLQAVPSFPPTQESSYATVESEWILLQRRRFLWLPPEYRNCPTAVCMYTVCLGCTSGRVAILSLQ